MSRSCPSLSRSVVLAVTLVAGLALAGCSIGLPSSTTEKPGWPMSTQAPPG
ncbi:MAG TPA: hypothetical protein VFG43_00875 [Geminicoccaceae bacterium]|nr:hypothetical protein [Geminicoccaceae bacterium]